MGICTRIRNNKMLIQHNLFYFLGLCSSLYAQSPPCWFPFFTAKYLANQTNLEMDNLNKMCKQNQDQTDIVLKFLKKQ